jgi:hypothetical protein
MPNFSTDADLLRWEPALFRELVLDHQTLTEGDEATASGYEVQADGDFEARGVRPGHVIHLKNIEQGVDGWYEVLSVEGAGVLVAAVVGTGPDDWVPLPSATDLEFAIRTFDPQHEEARWALLERFGLATDAASPAADLERWILQERALRRASVALVLATLYRGQACAEAASGLARKAEHYARLYDAEVARVRLPLDRDADGRPDDVRGPASFRLRRD